MTPPRSPFPDYEMLCALAYMVYDWGRRNGFLEWRAGLNNHQEKSGLTFAEAGCMDATDPQAIVNTGNARLC